MYNNIYLLLIPDSWAMKWEYEDTHTVNICVCFINNSYIHK